MRYLFLLVCCYSFVYAQSKPNIFAICHPPISEEQIEKLAKEWQTNPITKAYYTSEESFRAWTDNRDTTLWTLCPYIQSRQKNVGLYIYTSKLKFIEPDTLHKKILNLCYYIQMYFPVLYFEDKIIITHDLKEKEVALAEFLSLYGHLFSQADITNLKKMYLKTAFDPLMPDFPERTNERLPKYEWEGSPDKLLDLVKKTKKFAKLEKKWNALYAYKEKHHAPYGREESPYSLGHYLSLSCLECPSFRCDSCFSYDFREYHTQKVEGKPIGIFGYIQYGKIHDSDTDYSHHYYYILAFPDKVIISGNRWVKSFHLRRFLHLYGDKFSVEEKKKMKEIYPFSVGTGITVHL